MALTLYINDDNFNISNGMNLAYVVTSTTGVYKFKILMELTYNLNTSPETKTISFTQSLNQNNEAIFDLSNIYRSLVTPMIVGRKKGNAPNTNVENQFANIHTLPINRGNFTELFSWSLVANNGMETFRGNANVMTLKFYEFYSTTETGVPTKQSGTEVSKTIFLMKGTGLEDEGVITDFGDYELDGQSKLFLNSNYNTKTNISNNKFVEIGKNEYHTLSFLNRCAINTNAEPSRIFVRYKDASGLSIGTLLIFNESASGGSYYTTASDGEDESCILHFGVGLENLQKLDTSEASYTGDRPDDVTGGRDAIKSYEVKAMNGSLSDVSETYIFEIVDYCDRYEQNRLAFLNRFGVWEYITLNKEVESSLKIKRETITKPLINQSSGSLPAAVAGQFINSSYPLDVAKQGVMNTQINVEESLTLFTDNLKSYEIDMIKDMMMSEQIHLLDGDNAKALILENTSMRLKGDKNTGLYDYELKFKYASPKYRL